MNTDTHAINTSVEVYARTMESKGVKPTSTRLLVYGCMAEAGYAMTATAMAQLLDTVCLSSITRTLSLFSQHHLVHSLSDNQGHLLFALCHESCEDEDCDENGHHHDHHAHFICEKCGRTICLHDQPIPTISLPEGFRVKDVSYLIHGICADCSRP